MNKLIIILLLIFITSPLAFAENVPNFPEVVGPLKVHINATNILYRLKNYTRSVESIVWYVENSDTHKVSTNITDSIRFSMDMPNDPCTLYIDVGLYYKDEFGDDAAEFYGTVVRVVRAHLSPVTRMGCDYISYSGTDDNVPIHFNINNDEGAYCEDFRNTNPCNNDDHDLLYLNMKIDPIDINFVNSNLEIETSGIGAKLWLDRRKTNDSHNNSNKFKLSGNRIYDLANTNFFVEALSCGSFHIKVKINGYKIHSGNIRYDAYAVNIGLQPPCGDFVDGLEGCEWSYLNQAISTSNVMNSLAYAADPDCSTYGVPFIVNQTRPRLPNINGVILSNYFGVPAYYSNVDVFWDNNDIFSVDDVLAFFMLGNWTRDYVQYLQNSEDYTIIYYSGFHAARKFYGQCPGKMSTWNLYLSKIPEKLIILHRDIQWSAGPITHRFIECPSLDPPLE